jgi:hypothetical protein
MPAFAVRLTMMVIFAGCIVLTMTFAPWWGSIPVVLLFAYQGFWIIMLLRRRSQGRLPKLPTKGI